MNNPQGLRPADCVNQNDSTQAQIIAQTPRNTEELRRFLLESMADVASGKMAVERAKQISSLAQQVHNTIRTELCVLNALPIDDGDPRRIKRISLCADDD